VGVVSGTVLACRATLKMDSVLDEATIKMDKVHNFEDHNIPKKIVNMIYLLFVFRLE
jgi:hypothetical protein